jgi:hypothetical protein
MDDYDTKSSLLRDVSSASPTDKYFAALCLKQYLLHSLIVKACFLHMHQVDRTADMTKPTLDLQTQLARHVCELFDRIRVVHYSLHPGKQARQNPMLTTTLWTLGDAASPTEYQSAFHLLLSVLGVKWPQDQAWALHFLSNLTLGEILGFESALSTVGVDPDRKRFWAKRIAEYKTFLTFAAKLKGPPPPDAGEVPVALAQEYETESESGDEWDDDDDDETEDHDAQRPLNRVPQIKGTYDVSDLLCKYLSGGLQNILRKEEPLSAIPLRPTVYLFETEIPRHVLRASVAPRETIPENKLELKAYEDMLLDAFVVLAGRVAVTTILRGLHKALPIVQRFAETGLEKDDFPWQAYVFQILKHSGLASGRENFTAWIHHVQQALGEAEVPERKKVEANEALQHRLFELDKLASWLLARLRESDMLDVTKGTFLLPKLHAYKGKLAEHIFLTDATPLQPQSDFEMTSVLHDIVKDVERNREVQAAAVVRKFHMSSGIVTLQGLRKTISVTWNLCSRLLRNPELATAHDLILFQLYYALDKATNFLQANIDTLTAPDWDVRALSEVDALLGTRHPESSWVDRIRGVGDRNRQAREWLHTTVPNDLKIKSALWLWQVFVRDEQWPRPDDIEEDLLNKAARTRDPILFVERAIRRRSMKAAADMSTRTKVFETMCNCPPWRSIPAWYPGLMTPLAAPRMDPFLGLTQLRGVVSYRYLEPKPRWATAFPHLPVIVLLGDGHRLDTCGSPCDEALRCKRLGGPSHSFVEYLDRSPLFDGLNPDFVYENWVPKLSRNVARDPHPQSFKLGNTTLDETSQYLWDCTGPLRSPRCPLKRLRVHAADVRSIVYQQTLTRLGTGTGPTGATTVRPSYTDLYGILIQAGKQGRPEQFVEACAAAYPGWDVEDIVCSMFSSNAFEDIDNPHLRRERVAHEFYQMDPAIQDAIRKSMAPATTAWLHYPYDIVGTVVEWLQTCKPGQVMHPLVVTDIKALVRVAGNALDASC